jgi:serine/threonine protein kinase
MEIELLSRFSHKNIVSYFGSQKTKTTFNIFLEYISGKWSCSFSKMLGGTISSLLEKYGPFNENLIKVYTKQILEGLEYLHVRNTVHRDIKGANVLVDNSGVCKLTDFGTAKRISSIVEADMKHLPSIRGTINWMAPEVIKQTNLGRYIYF